MTTCLSNESHPFTTPVPSFILKPRGEKDNILCSGGALPFVAGETTFGRGLRIRSSFDEEDGESLERRGRAKSLGELLPGVAVEPPEWAVRACGEARLEVRFVAMIEHRMLTVVPALWLLLTAALMQRLLDLKERGLARCRSCRA